MSKALNATGRPIAYSCSWPVYIGGLPPNVSCQNYEYANNIPSIPSICDLCDPSVCFLALSPCSTQVNYSLLGDICNLWRNFNDIEDSWDSVLSISDWFHTNQDDLQPAAGPGRWNDPDMVR